MLEAASGTDDMEVSHYEEMRKMICVLIEYGKTVEFTAEIRRELSEQFQSNKEMRELFYRLERRQIQ